jgi:hypothetical protein
MITQIDYNWYAVNPGVGEEYCSYIVGRAGVIKIEEHGAAGDGDRWFYRVYFDNGNEIMIFNPNKVYKTK